MNRTERLQVFFHEVGEAGETLSYQEIQSVAQSCGGEFVCWTEGDLDRILGSSFMLLNGHRKPVRAFQVQEDRSVSWKEPYVFCSPELEGHPDRI